MDTDRASRLARARVALEGLSVGDAFGQELFLRDDIALALVYDREPPAGPLRYTDDTVMALGIVEVLHDEGTVHQDRLARVFARRYREDPLRGYGGTAHEVLRALGAGADWREVGGELLAHVLGHTPAGATRRGIVRAAEILEAGGSVIAAAEELGSGRRVLSLNTVPFALFCAASHLERYEDAIWGTLEGLGDRDTTCAMVGGVVASGVGVDAIPSDWRRRREPL